MFKRMEKVESIDVLAKISYSKLIWSWRRFKKVTTRGALNLVAELGLREITGRGRYRAWGIL
jgi:hypothetical protein